MKYRFQFRRYRLPFRTPVRTAHGWWKDRDGLIVRLEDENRNVGLGEAAVIPWFGTETVEEAEAAGRELGEWVDDARLDSVPAKFRCLRNAIEAARAETISAAAKIAAGPTSSEKSVPYLGIAALLPAGRAVLEAIGPKADSGFRVFKWKVGVGDVADELSLLDDVCAALPEGAKLRLDANGAWDRKKAERWLERCADRPVEFIEQPCFAEASQGAALAGRTNDLLMGLANDFPTPIALDESLVSDGDVERWLGAGWPGIYVVKPSLFGEVAAVMAKLKKAQAPVVFSSALETAVGARAALRWAFSWSIEPESPPPSHLSSASHSTSPKNLPPAPAPRALGFGVWPLFADTRFDGPYVAPFLRIEDVERIDPEAVWNALN